MYKKWNNVKKQIPLSEICVEINVMTTPIIFSSPEHEMLRVSYSDQSLSDVRLSFHQQLLTKHLLKLPSPKKLFFFLRSTFVVSAWSFGFSFPPQRPMSSDFEGFSTPDFIHYIYFPILILEKEPVFSLFNVQC